MTAKCTRIGRSIGNKRGAISTATQASRIIDSIRRRRAAGESIALGAYQPTAAITAELQRQLGTEWVELN